MRHCFLSASEPSVRPDYEACKKQHLGQPNRSQVHWLVPATTGLTSITRVIRNAIPGVVTSCGRQSLKTNCVYPDRYTVHLGSARPVFPIGCTRVDLPFEVHLAVVCRSSIQSGNRQKVRIEAHLRQQDRWTVLKTSQWSPYGVLAVRMLSWLRQRFCSDLAIDLGTTSTQIALSGEGIRLDEPSVVAVPAGSRQVAGKGAAVGKLAHQMLGRTPESITAVRPLRHGVINDFELTEAMLRYFIRKAARRKMGLKPRVVVAVPGGITAVEKRAVFNTVERAGAGQVWLIEESRAAGVGAGLPVSEPLASMVCDIGGGTTEVAVMSLGDVVASRSIRVAGDAIDTAIVQYLRRQYSLRTGEFSAEQLKLHIGSAAPLDHELSHEISGLDTASGVPRKAVVTSEEVREALSGPLECIVDAVRATIENCQPELVADLADTGMVLTGGGALLRGIDRYLNQQLGIPVRIAEFPRTTVTRGAMICLDHLDQWSDRLDNGM